VDQTSKCGSSTGRGEEVKALEGMVERAEEEARGARLANT
jgi:hypothetical protein